MNVYDGFALGAAREGVLIDVRLADPFGRDGEKLAAGAHAKFGQNVVRWLGKGFTKPDWVFVFEEHGDIVGGAAFNEFEPMELSVLDFTLDGAYKSDGSGLLEESVRLALRPGMRTVDYTLYNDTADFEEIREIFLAAGFTVCQNKLSFVFTKESLDEVSSALTMKPLTQLDEMTFVQAVARVTESTLDGKMAADALRFGALAAAQTYVDGLRRLDNRPEWWKLACDEHGEFVGLIVPQKLGERVGAINYIGVAPEKRGRGYVLELLREGTRTLLSAGVTKVIADIDVHNAPMDDALRRVGYDFDCEECVLEKRVTEDEGM